MRRSCPAQAASRSTVFWILPVEVFGSGPNSTRVARLEGGQPLPDMLNDVLGLSHRTVPQGHVRRRPLSPEVVRNPDDRDLRDRRVGGDGLFHLDRGDVLPA